MPLQNKTIGHEIKEQKEFYEFILENTHDGIWVTNKDDVIIYVNNGMEKIAGVSKDSIIGNNVLRDFPEETIREFSPYYLKAKETLSKIKYNANVTTPAKKKTVQDGWLIPIISENKYNGMICSIQDITESKELEKSLRLTQFSLDNAADAIFWVTKDAKLVYVNDAAVNMLGYTSEELITMYTHNINPNHPPEAWLEHWKEVKERKSFTFHSILKAKDGKIIPVEITVNYILFDNKEYNCAFVRDITERKKTDKSLVDSNAKLEEMNQIMKAVFDRTHIMAVLLDTNFNFIWVNRSYADTCHHDPSFFPGKNHFDLYPHEENELIFKNVVDTGASFFIIAKPFKFPDQPERGVTYWDWSLIPVKDSGKVTALVFTLLEVSARKKAEEGLRKVHDELEQRVRERTRELQEKNIALNVLLKQQAEVKNEMEQNILSNVTSLIQPYIMKLKRNNSNLEDMTYLNLIESNLEGIVSPFSQKLSSTYMKFTSKEIEIANLIKEGKKDKEIMEIMNIAFETVKGHRKNIRKKLGIHGKGTNLRNKLLSL